MKKRITSMFLVLLMVLSLMPATVQASPASGGSGTKADPYLIATAQDLIEFRDEVNALTKKSTSTLCAKLTKDIDLSRAYNQQQQAVSGIVRLCKRRRDQRPDGGRKCDHINQIFRICGRYRGLWISGHHRELCESGNGYGNKERIYCRYCRIYKYDRKQY